MPSSEFASITSFWSGLEYTKATLLKHQLELQERQDLREEKRHKLELKKEIRDKAESRISLESTVTFLQAMKDAET